MLPDLILFRNTTFGTIDFSSDMMGAGHIHPKKVINLEINEFYGDLR